MYKRTHVFQQLCIHAYFTAGIANNTLDVSPNNLRIILSKKERGRNSGHQWGLEDKSISIIPNFHVFSPL